MSGVTPGSISFFDPFNWSSLAHSSWTQPEGNVPTHMWECRVLDVNLTNWTIDCVSVFDQRTFLDVQVGSPYLHPNQGEGIYAVPEVGSKCIVCFPGDGGPPFVLCFIMPPETLPDTAVEGQATGTSETGSTMNATYAGGRTEPKLGDIVARGRDGNFMILHRGGVAQFGATQLAQRICVPLTNLVTDISQNYQHFNSGGAIKWGIRDLGEDSPETEYKQAIRLYADDEYADLRCALGLVQKPVLEPAGDAGETSANNRLDIGVDEPVVFEMVLAPGGFDGDTCDPKDPKETRDATKLRIFFDHAGGMMARFEASVNLRVKKKLRIVADEGFEFETNKQFKVDAESIALQAEKSLKLGAGSGSTMELNGGTKPIATVGSVVRTVITVPLAITTPAGPGTILSGQMLVGSVQTGNPTILG
jgi:hypothetical protein